MSLFVKGQVPWNKGKDDIFNCPICGKLVAFPHYMKRKFCSKSCADTDAVGKRRSPATERKKGHDFNETFEIGAVRIRVRSRDGQQRAWVKVRNDTHSSYDWRLRAVVTWESANGQVPKGFVVHHKDRDTLNDSPDNLELQSRAEHIMEHKHEFESRRREALSRKRNPEPSETVL